MERLSSIILDSNFHGVILELSEEYEPTTIIETQPYSPGIPLYDKSLFIMEPTLNLYIFSPPDYTNIKREELDNIKQHIKRIHLRPLHLTTGEHQTNIFTNYMLLGLTPEEVYETITPTSIPISLDLFKIMFIQAGRNSIIQTDRLSGRGIFIKDHTTYSFHPTGLNLKEYIIRELLPILPGLFEGYFYKLSSNHILIEGSHTIYPLFKLDSNYLQIEVTKYSMLNPNNINTYKVSLTLPDELNESWVETDQYRALGNSYLGIAGYTLYSISIYKDILLQTVYDLRTGKGMKLITEEDYTYTEKIKHIQLTEKDLTIDDLTIRGFKVIQTPQYALYFEEYYKKIIPEEVLERVKSDKKETIPVNIYREGLHYSDIFGPFYG